MTPLFAYLVKVIICSGIFYGYYHIALRNNRFHQWNRYYLLFTTLLSLVVPLLRIPLSFSPEASAQNIYVYTMTLKEQVFTPAVQVEQTDWFSWIYCSIIALFLARVAFSYWKILRLIYRGQVEIVRPFRFVLSEAITSPFSFFRYIFLQQPFQADTPKGRQMLQHEMVHAQEQHSVDKLIMECVTALCWINPFFHLMKHELSLVHEFIADKKAVRDGDVADYAETILQMALQTHQSLRLTNNFLQHPIKRRIFMLTQSRKLRFSYLRRLLILPVAAMIFSSLAFVIQQEEKKKEMQPQPKQVAQTQQQPAPPPPPAPPKTAQVKKTANGEEIHTFVEQPPKFPGGDEALAKYLNSNIRYPHAATDKGTQGTIFVSFVVTTEGAIKDVKTVGNPKGNGLEEEAIRVVKMMPKWNPGKQKGKNVNVQFNLPIRFTLQDQGETPPPPPAPAAKPQTKDGNEIFTFVEQPPTFPGGDEQLARYLNKNITYPKEGVKNNTTGTVFVSFIVKNDGTISDVNSVGKRLGDGLDEEAIRVVQSMPTWNPGKQNGKNVNVQFNLPIRFMLSAK